jgi:hypothetical protein
MKQSLSWDANTFPASEEISAPVVESVGSSFITFHNIVFSYGIKFIAPVQYREVRTTSFRKPKDVPGRVTGIDITRILCLNRSNSRF